MSFLTFLEKFIRPTRTDAGQVDEQEHLPREVQNYLDNRIRDVTDRLSQQNAQNISDLMREKFRFLDYVKPYLLLLGAILTVFYFFGGKTWLQRFAEQATRDYLTTNVAHQVLIKTHEDAARQFTQNELRPMQRRIEQLDEFAVTIRQGLENQQLSFSNRLRIQELSIGARLGLRADFEALLEVATNRFEWSQGATAALQELDLYFSQYALSIFKPILVDPLSREQVMESIDEQVARLLGPDPAGRRGAAIALKERRQTNAVQALCIQLERETNLFSVVELVAAVSATTGIGVRTLEATEVLNWWKLNQTNEMYRAPYAAFINHIINETNEPVIFSEKAAYTLRLADDLIASEPNACWARYIRSRILMNGGKFDEALSEIEEMKQRMPKFALLHIAIAELALRKGNRAQAIAAINEAFRLRPSIALELAAAKSFYGDVLGDADIKWPSGSRSIKP